MKCSAFISFAIIFMSILEAETWWDNIPYQMLKEYYDAIKELMRRNESAPHHGEIHIWSSRLERLLN